MDNNKPEIRIKGYSEEWKTKKFSEMFTLLQNNTLSRDSLSDEGPALDVHYGDILIKYGECLDVKNADLPHIPSGEIVQKFKASLLKDGDVIIADTAEDETAGKCCELLNVEDTQLIAGLHTMPYRPNDQYAAKFLGYYMNSSAFHDQLLPLMQGSKVTSISKSAIADTLLKYPITELEQSKIAEILYSLDNQITNLQEKKTSLVIIKNSFLNRMFPQNGESVPRIRFKGFTESWEQRKLGDVFKEYSEKNHEELPALTIIQGGGTILREESDRNLQYDKSNLAGYKMVKKDDFIVHLRSFEGGLERANTDGIISPAYHTFHGDNVDSRFYYPYFRSFDFINRKLVAHVYGIRDGRSIDIDGMKTIDIPYTSYEEQKKIGDYLDNLDSFISLYQLEMGCLCQIKKALSHKLFV